MLDNTKFSVLELQIINRVLRHPDFIVCRPKNNYYHSLQHKTYGAKLRLDFRKAVENGKVIGYGHLEISVSPHYHYNQYKHNGNDFTPVNCIKTILDIFIYLGIKPDEYDILKVVNMEYGLNIIPNTDIKNLIDGLLFYKKTPFKVGEFPYFKINDATSYKQIKAYAKGLQFIEFPQYEINPNTLRFEVKTKQAKCIKKHGIYNANDLLKLETYNALQQSLLDEWEQMLLVNFETNLSHLETDEVEFIKKCETMDFWKDLKILKHRNTFSLNKEKYYNILGTKNNLQTQIKLQIIDKLFDFSKCADSTQKTPMNREKLRLEKTSSPLINLEYAHLNKCLVTKLDISMQKNGSKFLCIGGLKYYKENSPEVYSNLEKKYLSDKMQFKSLEEQMYYMAHNIRNNYTNPKHNPKYSRKRFENRNYKTNQLQFSYD